LPVAAIIAPSGEVHPSPATDSCRRVRSERWLKTFRRGPPEFGPETGKFRMWNKDSSGLPACQRRSRPFGPAGRPGRTCWVVRRGV